jgi:hypothetical protein
LSWNAESYLVPWEFRKSGREVQPFGEEVWLLCTSNGRRISLIWDRGFLPIKHGVAEGFSMRKIAIALIACFAAATLAGCVGKGKAPIGKGKGKAPAPAVVTKG